MTGPDRLALTEEQVSIAYASATSRVLVIAPAGSGKTEVVAHRLAALQSGGGAAAGILVLSFSNAAVAELRRRARHAGPEVAATPVSTLDSYASRLLAIHESNGSWHDEVYLERIRHATPLVVGDTGVSEEIARYRHLILDEAQDFVGDRADFVEALIASLAPEAGYTVLGDPAQGVFDFQLDGSVSTTTSPQFLRRLLAQEPSPEMAHLTSSFRARTKATKRIAELGDVLRDRALGVAVSGDGGIETELLSLQPYRLSQVVSILRGGQLDGATGAVLCRYNSQALVVSREFRLAGLRHTLRGPAGDAWVGPWLALLLRGYRFPAISRRSFIERCAAIPGTVAEPETTWKALKRLEGRSSPDLSLRTLVSRLRTAHLPDSLVEETGDGAVVSSVHRAKGLEWDAVFLCGIAIDPDKDLETLRLAYVAMTRAREELFVLAEPDTSWMTSRDQRDGRWIRIDPRSRRMTQIQVVSDDTDLSAPGGALLLEADPLAIQGYLASEVRRGDAVNLVLERSYVEGAPRAVYRIEHEGRPIGITSTDLSDALLEGVRRAGGGPFPAELTGARVQAVETVGGSSAAGNRAGLGNAGLWLRPRLEGLADANWRRE